MGPSGPTGATGPSGPQGPSGATGPAGSVPITNNTGATTAGAHIVYGTATLPGGSPDSVTVTLSGAAGFTSASSYDCTANDTQSPDAIQVSNVDGADFTLIGSGDAADVSYICVGH